MLLVAQTCQEITHKDEQCRRSNLQLVAVGSLLLLEISNPRQTHLQVVEVDLCLQLLCRQLVAVDLHQRSQLPAQIFKQRRQLQA